MAKHDFAVGIDVGGTGIKGAVVDLATGELVTDRIKVATPKGGEPDAIVSTVSDIVSELGKQAKGLPVGVCFPAIVRHGVTQSAANVSKKWVGLDAEALFEKKLGLDITFMNDADAAGYAEAKYGAARVQPGLTVVTTLGTGIGGALLFDGKLIPNFEPGHIDIGEHEDYERFASYAAKERENLDWDEWAKRLQVFYERLEFMFSPDLIVVGGGVSKHHDKFLPLLNLNTSIVPATMRNNAGIIGAARFAAPATKKKS